MVKLCQWFERMMNPEPLNAPKALCMMRISTGQKVTIARIISNFIVGVRAIFGLSPIARVYRQSLCWSLDLREGIDLAIYLGIFDLKMTRAIKQILKPGNIAVDIGANIGALTLPLAHYVGVSGHVIAFEPTRWAYDKLQKNLSLNPYLFNRVKTEQIMLLEKEKEPPSFVYASWNLAIQKNALKHPQHKGILMSTHGAQVISLDRYFEEHPEQKIDLIKLDVDGYEASVLKGARKTLSHYQPKIILEMAPYVQKERQQFEEFLFELQRANYRLEDLSSKCPIPLTKEAIEKLCPPGIAIDVLAIPQ